MALAFDTATFDTVTLDTGLTTVAGVLVVFLGSWLTRHIRFLAEYRIPEPVSGGLLAAVVLAVCAGAGIHVRLDVALRDALLLVFFATLGLSVQLPLLGHGGRPFVLLALMATLMVMAQDIVGVATAMLLDIDLRYGLVAGSIAMSGGHGTAIAWGEPLTQAGLVGADEFGIAAATLGLLAGGLLGGPIGHRYIKRYQLTPSMADDADTSVGQKLDRPQAQITPERALRAVLVLAITIGIGLAVHGQMEPAGFRMPAFVYCLLAGILVSNLVGRPFFGFLQPWPGDGPTLALVNQLSLNLFLAMSLMSIDLMALAGFAVSILVVALMQVMLMVLVLAPLCFRLLGRDYDAAVVSAGLVGMGLGATPTAIANMSALTTRYGPSPRAFLIIPLVGAMLIDAINALVVNGALALLG